MFYVVSWGRPGLMPDGRRCSIDDPGTRTAVSAYAKNVQEEAKSTAAPATREEQDIRDHRLLEEAMAESVGQWVSPQDLPE